MKRGANEWGRRRFVVDLRSDRRGIRGVIRNPATGEVVAFASRASFLLRMAALVPAPQLPSASGSDDASAPASEGRCRSRERS